MFPRRVPSHSPSILWQPLEVGSGSPFYGWEHRSPKWLKRFVSGLVISKWCSLGCMPAIAGLLAVLSSTMNTAAGRGAIRGGAVVWDAETRPESLFGWLGCRWPHFSPWLWDRPVSGALPGAQGQPPGICAHTSCQHHLLTHWWVVTGLAAIDRELLVNTYWMLRMGLGAVSPRKDPTSGQVPSLGVAGLG